MVFHIADNGALAPSIPIPCAEGIVNIVLGKGAQQFVEPGIGFVYDLLMQTAVELRHIRIEPDKLHIAGSKDGAADSGISLHHGVFLVRVAAGVAVAHILHDGSRYYRLVSFILLPYSGGLCLRLPALTLRQRLFRTFPDFIADGQRVHPRCCGKAHVVENIVNIRFFQPAGGKIALPCGYFAHLAKRYLMVQPGLQVGVYLAVHRQRHIVPATIPAVLRTRVIV